jgi:hypothetical protein
MDEFGGVDRVGQRDDRSARLTGRRSRWSDDFGVGTDDEYASALDGVLRRRSPVSRERVSEPPQLSASCQHGGPWPVVIERRQGGAQDAAFVEAALAAIGRSLSGSAVALRGSVLARVVGDAPAPVWRVATQAVKARRSVLACRSPMRDGREHARLVLG